MSTTGQPSNPTESPPPAALAELRGYTRNEMVASLIMIIVIPLFLLLASPQQEFGVASGLMVLATAAFAVLHSRRLAARMRTPAEPTPLAAAAVHVGAATLAGCLAIVANPTMGWLCLVLPGAATADTLVARSRTAGRRLLAVVSPAVGVSAGTTMLLSTSAVNPWLPALWTTVGGALAVYVMAAYEVTRMSLWKSTMDLEQARLDAASVATMRERLRLAEDLHDILGHALEGVALKSELAARLTTIDPERANAELVEVQRLARDSLQDVRDLVHRQRPTDLVIELAGVRALLESAEISCTVVGSPQELDVATRNLLGRVLREAATNVLRHADATRCVITVERTARQASLRIVNDGVGQADREPDSRDRSGLDGLRRRLADAHGDLRAGPGAEPGTFELYATVPVGETS